MRERHGVMSRDFSEDRTPSTRQVLVESISRGGILFCFFSSFFFFFLFFFLTQEKRWRLGLASIADRVT